MDGALEVPAFFSIQLQESSRIFQYLFVRFNLHEEMRNLGLDAAVAADIDFPAGVHADHAHILDAGFGAIARTARHRDLDLVRCIHPPQFLFQLLAHQRGILRTEAAPFGADASLHRAQCFRIRMAARHVQILPHCRQVFLLHAQQIDTLAAGDFHCRNLVLIDHVGDAAQFGCIRLAAPHARDDGVGAILLDVGMRALVDEARLRIVFRLMRPGRDQVIVQRRAARRTAIRRTPLHEADHIRNRQQLVDLDRIAHFLMRVVGAAAHRLGLAGRFIVAARGEGNDLLDQAGAGTARGGSFGVLSHVLQCEQALFLDCLDDGALAHAVATADFGFVRHRTGLAVAFVAGVAGTTGIAFAEHQRVADIGNIFSFAHQLEVPAAIDGVAIEASADQLVVLDDKLLVHATDRVGQQDFFRAFAAHEFAGGEQVDAGDLQLGRGDRALVAADAEVRQVVRADLRHFEQRRNETICSAAMVDALADCIDARVVGLHRVVDDDAAIAMQAGRFRQRGIRANADGHHDEFGRHLEAIGEADRLHAAVFITNQFLRVLFKQELQAAIFQRLLQHLARSRIELAFHQPVRQVHDRHVHAAQLEAIGRFKTEQAAADDHRMLVLRRGFDHRVGVLDVAIGDHALQVLARHRQHERIRTGGEQQAIIFGSGAVFGDHQALDAIDFRNLLAEVERDVVFLIPVDIVQHDVFDGLFACEHRREQDAVVVRIRLGTEHGDLIDIGGDLQEFFESAHTRHAVADHDQFQLLH